MTESVRAIDGREVSEETYGLHLQIQGMQEHIGMLERDVKLLTHWLDVLKGMNQKLMEQLCQH